MSIRNSIRKRANTYFFFKVAVNLLLIVVGAFLIFQFMRLIQREAALNRQTRDSTLALTEAVTALEENAVEAKELTRVFHDGNQDTLEDLRELLSGGLLETLTAADGAARTDAAADIAARSGAERLLVLDGGGKVLLSSGKDAGSAGTVPQGEGLQRLLRGTRLAGGSVDPVRADDSYAYYSVRAPYGEGECVLVLGADTSVQDLQTRSLNDPSFVLRQAAVGNGGFLFAVDTETGGFLYYDDGTEVLTGRSAAAEGLSEAALQDGYAGAETIRGVRYQCVSEAFGEHAVLCAATEMDRVLSNDRKVLFWSISGFVLVMLLCLVYTVIVRNDFVRNAVDTKKTVIHRGGGSPLIFDRSVFAKVFPLMIAGMLLIFALSFYTQTLLEISEGIRRSEVALEEVSARYRENAENRAVIRNYYDQRFLSKAKLIAYLLEEDPSALNEPGARFHSYYDEAGDRRFLTDDEGNRLRSVAFSERLRRLCEANDLESVYVFDENGRTIATSTGDWYFTLSRDPKDQSYAFLQVLDGRKDEYVQEPMTNDLGRIAQYIGVSFTYYTESDGAGSTVYKSRRDWQEGGTAGGITAHRALIQIGLKEELSTRLLASTDLGDELSSNMLGDGAILLFEGAGEHVCIYSPREESIGMPAEKMGISAKAFAPGDYYGFIDVNGTSCFLFSRYADGHYVVTAIPRSSMFLTRGKISLATAVISFLLILFLSGTVTLTSEEEESLYATMSEEQEVKGLNAAIFSIILPSGRRTSTVRAGARWDNRYVPWGEKTPEQKLVFLITIVGVILTACVLVSVAGARVFYGDGSVVRYILSRDWDRGLNIFALSNCALALIFAAVAVALFRIPVRLVTSLLGARSETVGHLLLSVLKYGGAIGVIFYCLYLLGMDSPSLLASAGVLSLVIGLGAQSLIKDILAGIFIVFEGEFRVGDIVTIDGYRGTVMDIGLRTTKVLGAEGNIKIYNNSDISGVLNMTKEASLAVTNIEIEYGQDLEYVEAVLRRDLPVLKEKNPMILSGPEYAGVSGLHGSGVELRIFTYCNEKDIMPINRFMNREVYQIFVRNGISIPFTNVTISNLDTQGRRTMADFHSAETSVTGGGSVGRVRSEIVVVDGDGENLDKALNMTERFGAARDLDRKSVLHMRLLAEEMFGLMRGVAGDAEATYWIRKEDGCFELHLRAQPSMTKEMRERLLSLSTSGKNEAARGFIGKLRDMIAERLLPEGEGPEGAGELMENGWADGGSGEGEWSLRRYRSDVEQKAGESEDADEALDEMGRSIVAKVADDVRIAIRGTRVEIAVYKTFRAER